MSRAKAIASAALGYALGSLASADIVAKRAAKGKPSAEQIDPNRHGSSNPGAANVRNLLGNRAGAAVFGLDMGKALVAGQIGRVLAGATGANAAAAAAVLGHCYPVQRGFAGGKGVAASFGQMLATFPAYLPVDIVLGAAAAKSDYWKQRPVANIAAICGLWIGLAGLWAQRGLPNGWGPQPSAAMPMAAAVSSVAIIQRFAVENRDAAE